MAPQHPLDPLSANEIRTAAAVVKDSFEHDRQRLRFVAVSLSEPPKAQLLEFPRQMIVRQADALVLDTDTGVVSEFVINLDTQTVTSITKHEPGTQPMFTPDDCDLAEEIVQSSSWVASVLLERHGIENMDQVACDPWSIHFASDEDAALAKNAQGVPTRRLFQAYLYHRNKDTGFDDNHFAHPIDVMPVVDLNSRKVVAIEGLDRSPPVEISRASVNYHRNLLNTNHSHLLSSWREERLAALDIVQPDGPSFQVDGYEVKWQKWSFRVGFNYREGLVLHNICYDERSIMFRASLVEMAVPYGDPHPPYQRKCAFDVGDYGLGFCANSLELGCDCVGSIHYFDATLSNAAGEPIIKSRVVCMHEEDGGILWKHVEYRNGHDESRRSRELVISSIATVANYEYLFYWRLRQDGSIHYDIKMSGILSTNVLSQNEMELNIPTHGVLVAPGGINAQVHQHMFCARLDMAVDGIQNTVSEVDIMSEPLSETNSYGNAFGPMETVLKTEKVAIRCGDVTRARCWKVSNAEGKLNPITGKPVSYKLYPFASGPAQPTLLMDRSCQVAIKGAFATANLWVTPHNDIERYPAGDFTPQSRGARGLPEWTKANRMIEGKDVVLWHAFGVCHVPRVEDFPVLPCEETGFALKPDGFFNGNPAIDVMAETNKESCMTKAYCGSS